MISLPQSRKSTFGYQLYLIGSVMKALMSIQHEVAKVHQQQKETGAVSKDDAGDIWTLLKYVDLVRR